MRDPEPKHRTTTATAAQLAQLGLQPGQNQLVYRCVQYRGCTGAVYRCQVCRVETSSGSVVRTAASLHLVSSSARIVVTDIDGTVTKSDIRGVLLPALGLSDWKHSGVVPLYHQVGCPQPPRHHLTLTSVPRSRGRATRCCTSPTAPSGRRT